MILNGTLKAFGFSDKLFFNWQCQVSFY